MGWFTNETVPVLVSKAAGEALAVAVEAGVHNEDTMPILMSRAHARMLACWPIGFLYWMMNCLVPLAQQQLLLPPHPLRPTMQLLKKQLLRKKRKRKRTPDLAAWGSLWLIQHNKKGEMEYVYAAMMLHSAEEEIDEKSVGAVLKAAGVDADEARVKALVAAVFRRHR